ncbi:MAG: DUF4157 domain-containing protein [Symploca sp. SIO2E9]|nr:DUF4157 domain-containing protein [Symploca sp. SIO2E9]
MANNSPQAKQAAQLHAIADNYPAQQQQPSQKKASPEPGGKENNTGLPDNLKSGIENLSGFSMDDVKVHFNSDKSAQLNAHAYAQGTDIHLASGQEKHLPHEAWHVVQQKQGRVKPTMQMKGEVNINDDAGLEKEAEVMGAKALQMNTNSIANLTSSSIVQKGVMQRYLIVDNTDYTRWYREMSATKVKDADIKTDLNMAITNIAIKMINALDAKNAYENTVIEAIRTDNVNANKLRSQITKWIVDNPGDKSSVKSHPDFGRKRQTRVYANYKDLALALYGWVSAKPNRHQEKEKAKEVQANDAIDYHLNSILLLINGWIERHTSKLQIKDDLKNHGTAINGHSWNIYQNYFEHAGKGNKTKLPASYTDVIINPQNYDVRQKTGILHDIMHYFMEKEKVEPTVNILGGMPALNATEINPAGGTSRVPYNRPRNSQIRENQLDALKLVNPAHLPGGTLNPVLVSGEESHKSYKFARSKNLPMFGRHSFTAARMMTMVQGADGTKKQISAMAWAIMAYWRQNYDHTSIPYHTLHEIMDFAPDFGIAYDPDHPMQGLDDFTHAGFIKILKEEILGNPKDRDIDKLIGQDTPTNVAAFFLQHRALWANHKVMTFLQTTVLPTADFLALNAEELYDFFDYNSINQDLLHKIPEERRQHVLSGSLLAT